MDDWIIFVFMGLALVPIIWHQVYLHLRMDTYRIVPKYNGTFVVEYCIFSEYHKDETFYNEQDAEFYIKDKIAARQKERKFYAENPCRTVPPYKYIAN